MLEALVLICACLLQRQSCLMWMGQTHLTVHAGLQLHFHGADYVHDYGYLTTHYLSMLLY